MESRPLPERPAARRARLGGLALAGLGSTVVAGYFLIPLAGRAVVGAVEVLVAGGVWLATSIAVGVSFWDVLRTIGRAALTSLVTPAGSVALSILVLVGVMALYWLQRLLESEGESQS